MPRYRKKTESALTRQQLSKIVSKKTGLIIPDCQVVIDATLEAMFEHLAGGDGIYFRQFGSFLVRKREATVGRNPMNGEEVDIPAHMRVTFIASKHLKVRLRKLPVAS